MTKRVADVVIETLQAAGVKRCWGVPGDTLNFVTDAIRRSEIEWVHVRHEEVGGFGVWYRAQLGQGRALRQSQRCVGTGDRQLILGRA